LILLHEFSKYLVPPDGCSDSGSSSEEDEFSSDLVDVLNDGSVKKFKPGQFECKLVYRQSFPLHPRLKQNQALNGIASSTLDSFSVVNRKDMFVIDKGDYIIYLKLFEIEASQTCVDDENIDDPSLNTNDDPQKSPPSKNGASLPKTASPNSKKLYASTRDSRELVVKVFGLETPGKEITEKLMETLEKRLNSHITLTVISTFLARSRRVNPTREVS
jgi:hypothetical protein